ncbi:MAG: hypothetical protein HYV07_14495 [Deltaproteobacteria bacterium]|nr:hypothetical protein [Deltaproteobacteria bacterium]
MSTRSLPEGTRFVALLPRADTEIIGPGSPLLRVTAPVGAIAVEGMGTDTFVVGAFGDEIDESRPRLTSAPVREAQPADLELPGPRHWFHGELEGRELRLSASERAYTITSDAMRECPAFPPSRAQVSCAFCAPAVTQHGCSLQLDVEACAATPMSLSVGSDGSLRTAGPHPGFGDCSSVPATDGAVASVICEAAVDCRFDLHQITPEPTLPYEAQSILIAGPVFDIAASGGDIWAMSWAGGTAPPDCSVSPSVLTRVRLSPFEVIATATAASCLVTLTWEPSEERFLAFRGIPPALLALDERGMTLFEKPLPPELGAPTTVAHDSSTHQLAASFGAPPTHRALTFDATTLEVTRDEVPRGTIRSMWFTGGELRALTIHPDALEMIGGESKALGCINDNLGPVHASVLSDQSVLLASETPRSFAALVEPTCLPLPLFDHEAIGTTSMALDQGGVVAFTDVAGEHTARLAFIGADQRRLVPGSVEIGRGRTSKLLGSGEAIVALLDDSGMLTLIRPRP